jgi:tyrosyl-tRNA synthetase
MGFIEELQSRNILAQITHEEELKQHLAEKPRSAYVGYDPTADSLHVGHLIPTLAMRRWQKAGHRAVIVLGGGTSQIGDPTGKTDMRKMLDPDFRAQNIEKFRKQLSQFIDFSTPEKGIIRDNSEWLEKLDYLPFITEIGKHMSVNRMLAAECFKKRLETGLTFMEFNYMCLQSYDFLHLFREEDVTVQLGGDDQWSNVLAGMELVRKIERGQAFCATVPLLVKSDGSKMGKSEGGAVWLDPNKLKPFDFFQYWRNIEDDSVETCLNMLTDVDPGEVKELSSLEGAKINQAKIRLAYEITALVHGEEEASKAKTTAEALYTGGANAKPQNIPEVEITSSDFGDGLDILSLLSTAKVFPSKKEGRRLIEQGGVLLNEEKVTDPKKMVTISDFKEDGCLVKKGKKNYYLLKMV